MAKMKVRVLKTPEVMFVCLEDLIQYYTDEYTELACTLENGNAANIQNTDTARILLFLTSLEEGFNEQ